MGWVRHPPPSGLSKFWHKVSIHSYSFFLKNVSASALVVTALVPEPLHQTGEIFFWGCVRKRYSPYINILLSWQGSHSHTSFLSLPFFTKTTEMWRNLTSGNFPLTPLMLSVVTHLWNCAHTHKPYFYSSISPGFRQQMFWLHVPLFYQTITLRRRSLRPLLNIIACMVSLSVEHYYPYGESLSLT